MRDKRVKMGLIGLGPRGFYLMDTIVHMDEIEIAAICDVNPDTFAAIFPYFDRTNQRRPDTYTDYRELLSREDVEGVIIATNWNMHADIAIAAMKAGKNPGMEVAGASSIEECWALIRASEETGIPCMMLENCCYGKDEMTVLNMIKRGLFGEIVHGECGYAHDLRRELCETTVNRLHHNMRRNGNLYPTHGVGPVSKMLNINRGNRFLSLTSMASKARGLNAWACEHKGGDHPLARYDFAKGDVVQTMLKCAQGETVLITHNVSLPRPYSRYNVIQGTKGIYMEDKRGVYIEGRTAEEKWDTIDGYFAEYGHPLWKRYEQEGVRGGHAGMDYLVLAAFAESVANRTEPPIDVYDAATWMAITALSEQSVALGGATVAFPDFTRGKWVENRPVVRSKYALDEVFA